MNKSKRQVRGKGRNILGQAKITYKSPVRGRGELGASTQLGHQVGECGRVMHSAVVGDKPGSARRALLRGRDGLLSARAQEIRERNMRMQCVH